MAGKKFINAKLKGYNELQEILVEDGVFKAIAPHIDVDSDCEIEDLGGRLTLPPYVDHIFILIMYSQQESRAQLTEQEHYLKEFKGGVKLNQI